MKQCYVTLLKAIKLAGSQKELALILGVDPANLNKWVHYKRSMPTKYGHIIEDWSDGIITKQALFPENKDLQPTIDNVKTKDKEVIDTDGVFIFIGHTPNTGFLDGQVNLDESGYIVVDQRMKTNLDGVFAAGEVADPHFRQVITSAGMGAAAAIEATHFLEGYQE